MDRGINRFFDTFHIGTYFLQKNARTGRHIQDMRDCGIDLIFGMDYDRQALDLCHKYGIQAVVSGIIPGWFGGNGDNAGTMAQTRKKEDYVQGISAFADHPAIIGIDAGDEPSAVDFPYYGQILRLLQELLPSKFPYLNVYPSYGMLAENSEAQIQKELGTSSYAAYIASYGEHIDLPYLSFDHYVYSSERSRLFGDLATTAAYCKKNQKKLFVVLQVNSQKKDIFLSTEQLCFQAFSAMAYGAHTLTWACYSAGWWHNQVLDADGNQTEQYAKLKAVNHRIRVLADAYSDYRWIHTEIIPKDGTAEFGAFRSIRPSDEALFGKFEREDGTHSIFLCSTDENGFSPLALTFALPTGKQAKLYGQGKCALLSPDENTYAVTLDSAEACFITAM